MENMTKPIRVGIIGVGNCASSLVQGVHYYGHQGPAHPGLMHRELGGYRIKDIEFTSAFDVAGPKVGKDLSEAIFAEPNNTIRFVEEVPYLDVPVSRGMTLDGFGPQLEAFVEKAPGPSVDVVKTLKDTNTQVLINFLPVGSEDATRFYAEAALQAGCAFINCMPVFIASDETGYWPTRFMDAGLPIIGDDVKSQLGATILHRTLARLFEERGLVLDKTYQLNFGGNTDFLNMLDRDRLESKKISKTQSVQSQLQYGLNPEDIHVGPSDHVPWLDDRKWAYIRMEGRNFGDAPINVEIKLEVWDSPNSAGVVIEAIRYVAIALERGISGPLNAPSAWLMKSPPTQMTDPEALTACDEWVRS